MHAVRIAEREEVTMAPAQNRNTEAGAFVDALLPRTGT